MNNVSDSPFHKGEQEIQSRLGVRERMERFGKQVIVDFLPAQHRDFYAQLPFIFIAHKDEDSWPWASILFNLPGFIHSPNEKQLDIQATAVPGDPLNAFLSKTKRAFTLGKGRTLEDKPRLGLLGIELPTRRRNRLSAEISHITEQVIQLRVLQAFGNCPQYIQARELEYLVQDTRPEVVNKEIQRFDKQTTEFIERADTFFVASFKDENNLYSGEGDSGHSASAGMDVSHRGGKPGFIRVDDEYSLTIPDYLGNYHFNTLGNFLAIPKAGLLFIDFEKGHLLTLTGSVEILWDSSETQYFDGAQRLWTFKIEKGFWIKNALPFHWKAE